MAARLAPGEGRAGSPKVKALHHRPSRSPDRVRVIAGLGEGAVGDLRMERLSLAEGPGNRGEGCTNIVAKKYVSAGKSVWL
jgi:hypothetical protein